MNDENNKTNIDTDLERNNSLNNEKHIDVRLVEFDPMY